MNTVIAYLMYLIRKVLSFFFQETNIHLKVIMKKKWPTKKKKRTGGFLLTPLLFSAVKNARKGKDTGKGKKIKRITKNLHRREYPR